MSVPALTAAARPADDLFSADALFAAAEADARAARIERLCDVDSLFAQVDADVARRREQPRRVVRVVNKAC